MRCRLALTLTVLGPATPRKLQEIHTTFARRLAAKLKRRGLDSILVACNEVGRTSLRRHAHGVLAAASEVPPDLVSTTFADAVADLSPGCHARSYVRPVRNLRSWCDYAFKVGVHSGKAGPMLPSAERITWGQTVALYRGLAAESATRKTLRGKRAACRLAWLQALEDRRRRAARDRAREAVAVAVIIGDAFAGLAASGRRKVPRPAAHPPRPAAPPVARPIRGNGKKRKLSKPNDLRHDPPP
ncbi:hypothetical protein TA3x_005853 (plasmid) [Tundrisphaera sp. TA3]|uniref:hypothetical protein n=1 Tax=Tundrisphaera sp. TA3 TaxID=3435775 RepID=UPI003EBEDC6F